MAVAGETYLLKARLPETESGSWKSTSELSGPDVP
jgi:hypothetical protein